MGDSWSHQRKGFAKKDSGDNHRDTLENLRKGQAFLSELQQHRNCSFLE